MLLNFDGNPYYAIMDVYKFRDGEVTFRNSGKKGLINKYNVCLKKAFWNPSFMQINSGELLASMIIQINSKRFFIDVVR